MALLGVLAAGQAQAADFFTVQASSGSLSGSAAFKDINSLFQGLSEPSLAALLPGYLGGNAASMTIGFRGLTMESSYPDAGGPRLTLSIPRLGIDETFIGATREQSRKLLREYFKNGPGLGRIMLALAELSPVDPIAGNPTSLQTRMVTGDFDRRFGQLVSHLTQQETGWRSTAEGRRPVLLAALGSEPPPLANQDAGVSWRTGVELSRYTRDEFSSTVAAVPFGVALGRSGDAPLSIEGELQSTTTGSATHLGGHAGLSYRLKLNERWYLMPAASAGVVGSREMGSVGSLYAASVISAFRLFQNADYTLWMGNALHALRSGKLEVSDYSFDPKLRNTALTNGLTLVLNPGAFTQGGWWELSLADTRYFGSDLYDQRYDELGVSLLRRTVVGGVPVLLRGGLRYLSTTNSQGWGVQFQANF